MKTIKDMQMNPDWRSELSFGFQVPVKVTHLVQVAELRPVFRVQDLHLEKNIVFDAFSFSSCQAMITSGFNKLGNGE